MEKRIEVEINGRKKMIPEHMLEDYEKFGATLTKRVVKLPPELQSEKTVILPGKAGVVPPPKTAILPEMKERKKPVRSKSTK